MLNKNNFPDTKLTPIRKSIISVLETANQPITSRQILDAIKQKGVSAHRATVYRDIDFFVKKDLVKSYTFKDNPVLFYEIATDHHHHSVCESCGKIEIIYPENIEKEIEVFEKNTFSQTGFKINSHRLKFYGVCPACVKNKK